MLQKCQLQLILDLYFENLSFDSMFIIHHISFLTAIHYTLVHLKKIRILSILEGLDFVIPFLIHRGFRGG